MKHASGALWVRFFGKSIDERNSGYDVSGRPPTRTDCQGGGGGEGDYCILSSVVRHWEVPWAAYALAY